jgi:hypothetical protein
MRTLAAPHWQHLVIPRPGSLHSPHACIYTLGGILEKKGALCPMMKDWQVLPIPAAPCGASRACMCCASGDGWPATVEKSTHMYRPEDNVSHFFFPSSSASPSCSTQHVFPFVEVIRRWAHSPPCTFCVWRRRRHETVQLLGRHWRVKGAGGELIVEVPRGSHGE